MQFKISDDVVISDESGVKVVVKGKGWTPVEKVTWGDMVKIKKVSYPKGVMENPEITYEWVDAGSRITEL